MSGNLFTDIFPVKEAMFNTKCDIETEITNFQSRIATDISNHQTPKKLEYLALKITNRCNSNCIYCAHAVNRKNSEIYSDIPNELLWKCINEAAELGVSTIAIEGGEPLIRDDIIEIIENVISHGIVPMLLTNGLLLPKMWDKLGKTGLKYILISFDSLIKEVYEKQRGCSFEKALDAIETAVKMMKKYPGVEIHVSCVLTFHNMGDVVNIIKYMTIRGIKTNIIPFHNYLNINVNISNIDKVNIEELVETLINMKKNGYLIANSVGYLKHFVEFFSHNKNIPDDYICKIGYTNLFVDANKNIRPCWSDQIGIVGTLDSISYLL